MRLFGLLILCAFAALSSTADARERIALVFGSGAVAGDGRPPHPSARADSERMAAALRGAGFAVTSGFDLSRATMTDAAALVRNDLDAGTRVVLVAFSGRAMVRDGAMHLATPSGMLALDALLVPFQGGGRQVVALLDVGLEPACAGSLGAADVLIAGPSGSEGRVATGLVSALGGQEASIAEVLAAVAQAAEAPSGEAACVLGLDRRPAGISDPPEIPSSVR